MDSRDRQRGNAKGPTGRTVADNVRTVRIDRDMTQAQLSERLLAIGRPIPVGAIGKLETGLRNVDVDDLVALALALNTSPLRLLLPDSRRPLDLVEATGASVTAISLWEWGVGVMPLEGATALSQQEFQSWSLPWWFQVTSDVPSSYTIPGTTGEVETDG